MKIAWFQDLDPHTNGGGAELNDRAMITEGIRRNHDVEVIVAHQNDDVYNKPDLAVFSNSMEFGTAFYDQMKKLEVPYVLFVHDYGPWLCKHRLFYPMEERCKTLCYLRDRWRPYILGAKLVICLSPLHLEAWRFAYPETRDAICVPSSVPEGEFFDKGGPRSGACAVHSGLPFKGWPQVRDWAAAHPETPLTLIGPVPGDAPKNVVAAERVPYGGMNDWYNKFETFIHLPDRPMPFDRTVAEAYLAGCKVIGNENVGALSWPAFKDGEQAVRDLLRTAPRAFWEAVEGAQ